MNKALENELIDHYAKRLFLSTVRREYASLARQAADQGWSFEDYLRDLLELEVNARSESAIARRIREARFPDAKTLEQINWTELEGLSRQKVAELASSEWVEKGEDVILAGPIGTGKTHLAIALGIEAAKRGHRVVFTRAADLVRSLLEARDERSLEQLQKRYRKTALLILDELGFVPFERAGGELLFNLLAERYERNSTIVTSNLSFGEWVKVFGDEKLTTALLDRLSHHAHILTTKGASYRTRMRRNKSQKSESKRKGDK